MIQYLESTENEQVTIVDLTKLVERQLMNSEEAGPRTLKNPYLVLYMKNELKDYFLNGYSHCPYSLICSCHNMFTLSLMVGIASSGLAKIFDRRLVGADVCRLCYKKVWKATIVFDGYTYGPSTKDHKHLRRKIKTQQTKKGAKSDVM